ncbi:hypothetical protein ACFSX9_07725 [Flavobacterium ardleyense]|uniref:Uncharacterized protein n=1 Tax=Flavobacterium ardleyense TaxID=2038737 RepID=A0ABW5Z703_9FLAO
MKLTTEQIERLYEFTRQHFVEWYDLQTEFVDHLANSIETQWAENPKIAFEDALKIEFKKFGVFGFMDVVDNRKIALNKKYNKIVWKHFKAFFTIPKGIATFSLMFVFYFTLMYLNDLAGLLINTLLILVLVSFWIATIFQRMKNNKQEKITGKKWLFHQIISGYSTFLALSYLPTQIMMRVDYESGLSVFKAVFFSVLIVSLYLLEYIIIFEIPSKAEQYLKETYPEYELI